MTAWRRSTSSPSVLGPTGSSRRPVVHAGASKAIPGSTSCPRWRRFARAACLGTMLEAMRPRHCSHRSTRWGRRGARCGMGGDDAGGAARRPPRRGDRPTSRAHRAQSPTGSHARSSSSCPFTLAGLVEGHPRTAGLRSLGLPGCRLVTLARLLISFRERRGDSHRNSWVAAGFDPFEINVLPELLARRPAGLGDDEPDGWSGGRLRERIGATRRGRPRRGARVDDEGKVVRDEIGPPTDQQEAVPPRSWRGSQDLSRSSIRGACGRDFRSAFWRRHLTCRRT